MSRRTLAVLSAVVAALALWVLADRPLAPEVDPYARRLLPDLRPSEITAVTLGVDGAPPVVLERGDAGFDLKAPVAVPAREAAVRDLLASLEMLSYRRRAPAADPRGTDAPRLRIQVTAGGRTREVRVGRPEEALGQVWMASSERPGEVFLVDDHHARALSPGVADLRGRDPFARASGEIRLQAGDAALVVRPKEKCVVVGAGCAPLAPEAAARLQDALSGLVLSRFVDAEPSEAELTVSVGDAALTVGGPCPGGEGERLARSHLGAGCVPESAVSDLASAVAAPLALVDRRLVRVDPHEVTFVAIEGLGGATLERDADEGVRDWLTELAGYRARDVRLAEAPAGPGASVRLETEGGTRRITAWREGPRLTVRRGDEPTLLDVHPEAARYFMADPAQLVPRSILRFEPYALRAVEVDGERAERGASAEDWTVTAPVEVPADLTSVEALRDAASSLRALRVVSATAEPAHGLTPPARTVSVEIDPPPLAPADAVPERHEIALGRATGEGCYARAGGGPVVVLAAADCDALSGPLATRVVHDLDPRRVSAVTLGRSRFQRTQSGWVDAEGRPVSATEAVALVELVAALAEADVAGYRPVRERTRVVVEAGGRTVTLVVGAPHFTRAGSPVAYRIPEAACAAWPTLCR